MNDQTITANIVISAVGILSNKKIPKFKNMDAFKGEIFHSSEWNHKYSMTGKKIGVIGSGPTAVQVIPGVMKKNIAKLYVFQRSINHTLPKDTLSSNWRYFWAMLFKLPFVQTLKRAQVFVFMDTFLYAAVKTGSFFAKYIENESAKYRKLVFGDNDLLMTQTQPTNEPLGKRLLFSNELYQSYKQENCELVTSGIDQFTENGIVCKDGKLTELDCVVLCTGFRSQEFLCSLKAGVIGKDGKCLQKDVWNVNDCFAYLGITVSDFPNLFLLYGPGTNLGHNSVLFMIECAADYTVECIEGMMKNGWNEIDVREDVMNEFVRRLDEENKKNSWMDPKCSNWYSNDKGRGSTNWAWSCFYYWWLTKSVKFDQYECS